MSMGRGRKDVIRYWALAAGLVADKSIENCLQQGRWEGLVRHSLRAELSGAVQKITYPSLQVVRLCCQAAVEAELLRQCQPELLARLRRHPEFAKLERIEVECGDNKKS